MVVVGAGPTGVEISGQIRELATRSLRGQFRTFDPASVRVLLVDGGGAARDASATNSRRRAARDLAAAGCRAAHGQHASPASIALGVDVVTGRGQLRVAARVA